MTTRYLSDSIIRDGKAISSANAVSRIRSLHKQGRISTKERVLQKGERLDIIAGDEFSNSTLWWVIAALSNIGWGMQAPPGTILVIPTDIKEVLEVI